MKHAVIGLAVWMLAPAMTPSAAGAVEHMYVGVAKCATCHKTAAQGEQLAKWQATEHAKAYATLAGAKAKELAKARGIEDPQKAPECLKCHVTGHGADPKLLGEKYLASDGVGCESCHGAGGDYYKKTTMEAIMSGTTDGASVGLVKPDKAVCEKCHNKESPSFQGFDFDKMVEKIKHPMPADRKAKYKPAASG